MQNQLSVIPLAREIFEPFGDVIEVSEAAETFSINDGYATRYHDLATIEIYGSGGRPLINIFRGRSRPLPLKIHMMERHPLGSQAFVPLHRNPFVIVVAPEGEFAGPDSLSAFITNGNQGVNYRRNIWHFPLLVLGDTSQDFLIIDRGGEGDNCEEHYFDKDSVCILKL